MKIRINPLTPAMLIAVAFCGNLRLYLLAYLVMALHEMAHLIASLFIGLKPESMTFSPFGVHLHLRCKIINSITDEIILYLAGPLINALFALIALILKMPDLYKLNTVLFIMNILPVSPLDGGMIALGLLSLHVGRKRAQRILSVICAVSGTILLATACYGLYIGYMNISLFIIAVLFIGNILTSKEMCDTDFLSAVSGRKKRTNRANIVIIDDVHTRTDALKTLSPMYTTIALVMDKNDKISGIVSEKELIETVDVL